jgi:hypothetical protein
VPERNSLDSTEGVMTEKVGENIRTIPEYKTKGKLSEFEEDKVPHPRKIPDIREVKLWTLAGKDSEAFIQSVHKKILRVGKKSPVLGIEAANFLLANAPDEWKGSRILLWDFFRSKDDFPVLKYLEFDTENEVWLVKNITLDVGGLATPGLPGAHNGTNIWGDTWKVPFVTEPFEESYDL